MDLLAMMRIYVRVVERGTMSAAARDLDLGQPAVSERIDRLEKFLGVRLLTRSSRTLTCTHEGRAFYENSRELLQAADKAVHSLAQMDHTLNGTIRIASAQCFGEIVLPRVLLRMQAKYPELKIDLVLNDAIVDPLTEGVDISLRLGRLTEGAYIAYPLGIVERILVATPSYLSRHGNINKPADLSRHPFIRVKGVFNNDHMPLSGPDASVDSVRIRTMMTTSHWRPMYEMISASSGIGVVQKPACAAALQQGKLVRLLPRYTVPAFPLNALVPAQRPLSPRITRIIEVLRDEIPRALLKEDKASLFS
ncbi:LysR family transcriptional regulator [Achromobacter insolitus]|uniref:LysR family transcriptional regulator n=1 Tax=Achromobacter insolitus TaxID=217204 RepID=UPI0007C7BFFD|nr:LysR family transcriptional regulator [Achromobacter insolitus]AXA71760.1 LysR family transcriptional regulator [Achromobacter insolitus]OAE50595.1 LysR family transcriptional regulator [Achromobacter insolitus]OCZ59748.1 LysR family transcriptional regulator [Achromobacter insolitus]